MRYCPDCGTGHECEAQAPAGESPEVAIARINAERDIAVAKLQARMAREELAIVEEVAETEAEAEVGAAVAEAAGMAAAAEVIAGTDAEPEPEPEPFVIDAPQQIVEDVHDDAPPPAEGSPAPEPQRKRTGLGVW